MIFQRKKQNSGFSLVEVLVAVSILLLVIVGPMQIIARSIYSTNFSTEQIVAWFLAQEGIELSQKIRDDLVLNDFKDQIAGVNNEPDPFTELQSSYSACFSANGCDLNITDNTNIGSSVDDVSCGVLSNCRLYLTPSSDADRSSYQHVSAGNTVTPYTRVIKFERFPASGKIREIKVTSTVSWRTGSLISSQKVEAVSYLFNVYDTN